MPFKSIKCFASQVNKCIIINNNYIPYIIVQVSQKYLLNPKLHSDNKKCVVIDLDETLVHSSFKVSAIVVYICTYTYVYAIMYVCTVPHKVHTSTQFSTYVYM